MNEAELSVSCLCVESCAGAYPVGHRETACMGYRDHEQLRISLGTISLGMSVFTLQTIHALSTLTAAWAATTAQNNTQAQPVSPRAAAARCARASAACAAAQAASQRGAGSAPSRAASSADTALSASVCTSASMPAQPGPAAAGHRLAGGTAVHARCTRQGSEQAPHTGRQVPPDAARAQGLLHRHTARTPPQTSMAGCAARHAASSQGLACKVSERPVEQRSTPHAVCQLTVRIRPPGGAMRARMCRAPARGSASAAAPARPASTTAMASAGAAPGPLSLVRNSCPASRSAARQRSASAPHRASDRPATRHFPMPAPLPAALVGQYQPTPAVAVFCC